MRDDLYDEPSSRLGGTAQHEPEIKKARSKVGQGTAPISPEDGRSSESQLKNGSKATSSTSSGLRRPSRYAESGIKPAEVESAVTSITRHDLGSNDIEVGTYVTGQSGRSKTNKPKQKVLEGGRVDKWLDGVNPAKIRPDDSVSHVGPIDDAEHTYRPGHGHQKRLPAPGEERLPKADFQPNKPASVAHSEVSQRGREKVPVHANVPPGDEKQSPLAAYMDDEKSVLTSTHHVGGAKGRPTRYAVNKTGDRLDKGKSRRSTEDDGYESYESHESYGRNERAPQIANFGRSRKPRASDLGPTGGGRIGHSRDSEAADERQVVGPARIAERTSEVERVGRDTRGKRTKHGNERINFEEYLGSETDSDGANDQALVLAKRPSDGAYSTIIRYGDSQG